MEYTENYIGDLVKCLATSRGETDGLRHYGLPVETEAAMRGYAQGSDDWYNYCRAFVRAQEK
jgi:hypothetical protein